MKLTQNPSKIVGIQFGEAKLNILRPGEPPLWAKFALLNKDGEVCGYADISSWSDKLVELLQQFTDALEEEALRLVFEGGSEEKKEEPNQERNEPPQF